MPSWVKFGREGSSAEQRRQREEQQSVAGTAEAVATAAIAGAAAASGVPASWVSATGAEGDGQEVNVRRCCWCVRLLGFRMINGGVNGSQKCGGIGDVGDSDDEAGRGGV